MEKFVATIDLGTFKLTMQGEGDTAAAAAKLNDVFRGGNVSVVGFGDMDEVMEGDG